ncbi:MAG: DUF1571 domain-containing protein [Planctomycetota bacterium]|nr:MAG: DUF1571 domain-containing protein [Planctomycetota bacterium]
MRIRSNHGLSLFAATSLVIAIGAFRLIDTARAVPGAELLPAALGQNIITVANPLPAPLPAKPALVELAKRDPEALADLGLKRYMQSVRDYRCLFVKQERVKGHLSKLEEIDVAYREHPHSVFMKWRRNADKVRRVLFVDNDEFVNDKGKKVAKVEPNGALVRLLVSEVEIEIHGKRAAESSRRPIDRFGFRQIYELLQEYNELGRANGVLDYRYAGEGEIDGRPTFKLVRHLPYTGEDGVYPDAMMVLHIDQQWLLPTALYSYADHAGKVLLGRYEYRNVVLNPGLTDADFRF